MVQQPQKYKLVAALKTVSLGACSLAQGSKSDDAVFGMSFETTAEIWIDFSIGKHAERFDHLVSS